MEAGQKQQRDEAPGIRNTQYGSYEQSELCTLYSVVSIRVLKLDVIFLIPSFIGSKLSAYFIHVTQCPVDLLWY